MRRAGMLFVLGVAACGGRTEPASDAVDTEDASDGEASTCPETCIVCGKASLCALYSCTPPVCPLTFTDSDAEAREDVTVDANVPPDGTCAAGNLLCAASCDPPVFRCQVSGFACLACPADAGIQDASVDAPVTTDGAACGQGEIVCRTAECGTNVTGCYSGDACPPDPCTMR